MNPTQSRFASLCLWAQALCFLILNPLFYRAGLVQGEAPALAALVSFVFPLVAIKGAKLPLKVSGEGLTAWWFVKLWALIFTVGYAVGLAVAPLSALLPALPTEGPAAGPTTTGFLFLIYSCFVGPVMEEVAYRGVALTVFRSRFTPLVAALLSSLLFGAAHHDLIQGIPAFCMGLILCWVSMRWGLKVSALMHIVHNCTVHITEWAFGAGWAMVVGVFATVFLILGLYALITTLRRERRPWPPLSGGRVAILVALTLFEVFVTLNNAFGWINF